MRHGQKHIRCATMAKTGKRMLETPLHDSHVALGARMIEFAGWDMPVFYSGINEEHLAVRKAAGLFDVSHMGDLVLRGKGSKELLQKLITNSIEDIPVGKGVYSHILNDEGMIIDDTIVYRTDLEEYLLVPNASKVKDVLQWFRVPRPCRPCGGHLRPGGLSGRSGPQGHRHRAAGQPCAYRQHQTVPFRSDRCRRPRSGRPALERQGDGRQDRLHR